jgi:enolase
MIASETLTTRWFCGDWKIEANVYNLAFKLLMSDSASKKEDRCTPEQMSTLYQELLGKYPIVLLEQPFAQDDLQA